MIKLLKAEDVAEIFDMSIDRVYQLARAYIIPSVRIGRQLRFDPIQIDEFIKSGGMALSEGCKNENK